MTNPDTEQKIKISKCHKIQFFLLLILSKKIIFEQGSMESYFRSTEYKFGQRKLEKSKIIQTKFSERLGNDKILHSKHTYTQIQLRLTFKTLLQSYDCNIDNHI